MTIWVRLKSLQLGTDKVHMFQKITLIIQLLEFMGHTEECPSRDGAGCSCCYAEAMTYFLNKQGEYENKFL